MSFFQIDGLKELESYVGYLASGGLRKEVVNYVAPIMKSELPKMVNDAPFRTGKLRNSGKFEMGTGKGIIAQIKFTAGHAGFVNFGTIWMPPRPFATNGYNRILSRLKKGK